MKAWAYRVLTLLYVSVYTVGPLSRHTIFFINCVLISGCIISVEIRQFLCSPVSMLYVRRTDMSVLMCLRRLVKETCRTICYHFMNDCGFLIIQIVYHHGNILREESFICVKLRERVKVILFNLLLY
jgi:hypothetical protein